MRTILILWLICLPILVNSQEAEARFGSGDTPILLRSTTDVSIIAPVLNRFTELNPDLSIAYEQWGSNALFETNRTACEHQSSAADAVLSSAVQHMVWLVNAACARRFVSPATTQLPNARKWRDELWGITEEPAVFVYNKEAFQDQEVPRNRFALLDLMRAQPERMRGRIATYDISASGLGYLFAHADSLEATTFGSMLEGFARVGAVATCCSSEIIRDVARGRYILAYNVLGSYVASRNDPNIGVILPEDYTLILSRSFMIPRHAAHPEAAARLLDFLLSDDGQRILTDIGLVMTADPAETGLLPSARRFVGLSPALLVALDRNRRSRLLSLWSNAFMRVTLP